MALWLEAYQKYPPQNKYTPSYRKVVKLKVASSKICCNWNVLKNHNLAKTASCKEKLQNCPQEKIVFNYTAAYINVLSKYNVSDYLSADYLPSPSAFINNYNHIIMIISFIILVAMVFFICLVCFYYNCVDRQHSLVRDTKLRVSPSLNSGVITFVLKINIIPATIIVIKMASRTGFSVCTVFQITQPRYETSLQRLWLKQTQTAAIH
ncbi:unnamed protein product [Didymodactylos carnosus]|uniref:Uncharacterized protein n=1 Tax=Didymodactylos carnosus TaxID=1234261 RepID=A0A814BSN7_9BILA|nr:unnamed protein product [Didymodactylos carnosus]CAF3710588.1 unnamed protein product [Didymodactylos carnosus]